MGGGGDPPPVQSAQQTEAQSLAANQQVGTQNQQGSMVAQSTPFGNLNYQQTGTGPGGIPLYSSQQTLSPQLQSILDTLQSDTNHQLSTGGFGTGTAADTIGGVTNGNTSALVNDWMKFMQPSFTTQTQQLDTQLRNQGLMPSQSSNPSDPSTWGPYERAMNQLQTNQNQALSGFVVQAEPQAYSQAVSNYLMPLTTSSALMNLIPSSYLPQSYTNPPQLNIQPTNVGQIQANTQDELNQQFEMEQQQQNALMNGLFGLGSATIGAAGKAGGFGALLSDERLKEDIERVGATDAGTPIYSYRLKGSDATQLGFMAQDLEEIVPDAVEETDDGWKTVDYARALRKGA